MQAATQEKNSTDERRSSNTPHTPGPWAITKQYDAPWTYTPRILVGPARIDFIQGYDVPGDPERKARAEADALLVGASTEMLEALKSAVVSLEQLVKLNRIPANNKGLRDARAAIAKAEGR